VTTQEPTWVTHDHAESAFRSRDATAICSALADAALTDSDRTWLEGWCVALAAHEEPAVRQMAATCIGHVARRFRSLEGPALAALEQLRRDPNVRGYAEDALEDVRAVYRAPS
jgi:hypothetical protein